MKSETKKKASAAIKAHHKTGGGEWEESDMDQIEESLAGFLAWEKKMVRLIGVEGILGIPDGIDTSDPSSFSTNDLNENAECSISPTMLSVWKL